MLLLTGALTSKPYAFTSRPWELRSVNSIDVLDGIGSNIRIDFKEAEIVRILPSRQAEINETWISDKIRFFYDGLKRQRLHLPYQKKNRSLKEVDWDETLTKLSSLFKVYSYEYGSSKIGLIAGPNLDIEAFYSIKDFASNFGFSNLGIDKFAQVNLDNPSAYKFQNQIQDLEKSDFCLLVGTNPRFEASILNLRLRKIFKRGTLKLAAVGGSFDPTYPIDFYGFSSTTLVAIAEGKHECCKALAKAKAPVIFYGWKIFERLDSKALSSLLSSIRNIFFQVFKKAISVNALATDSNVTGALELGIPCVKKSDATKMKVIFGVGLENSDLISDIEKTSSVSIFQACHGSERSKKADFLLPSLSFAEKSGVYFNTEGRPQKTQKALSGPNLSKDDWKIFNVLFHYLSKSSPYSKKNHLRKKVSMFLPSSMFANVWFAKNDGNLAHSFFFGKTRKEIVLKSSFKLFLEDFFMSSSLCHSSKVMAKASSNLRLSATNYKLLSYSFSKE
jgi:NADH dehydrogenase/NADH:ubiquinone oxidoreductase subunit G